MTAVATRSPRARGNSSGRGYRSLWTLLMLAVTGLLVARFPAVERELELRIQGADAPAEAATLDAAYTQLALRSGAGAALLVSIVLALVMLAVAMRVAARTRGAGSVTVRGVSIPLVLLVVAPAALLSQLSRLVGFTGTGATTVLLAVALGLAAGAAAIVKDHRWGWPARLALALTCAAVFTLF